MLSTWSERLDELSLATERIWHTLGGTPAGVVEADLQPLRLALPLERLGPTSSVLGSASRWGGRPKRNAPEGATQLVDAPPIELPASAAAERTPLAGRDVGDDNAQNGSAGSEVVFARPNGGRSKGGGAGKEGPISSEPGMGARSKVKMSPGTGLSETHAIGNATQPERSPAYPLNPGLKPNRSRRGAIGWLCTTNISHLQHEERNEADGAGGLETGVAVQLPLPAPSIVRPACRTALSHLRDRRAVSVNIAGRARSTIPGGGGGLFLQVADNSQGVEQGNPASEQLSLVSSIGRALSPVHRKWTVGPDSQRRQLARARASSPLSIHTAPPDRLPPPPPPPRLTAASSIRVSSVDLNLPDFAVIEERRYGRFGGPCFRADGGMGGGGLGSVDAIENGLLLEGRPPSLGVTSWLPWRAEPSAVLKEEKQEKGDSATHERGQGEIEYYAPADPAVLVAPPVSTVGSVGNPGSLVSNILKSSAGNPGGGSAHLCDRCDGRHATCNCPHYSHDRPDHPDARFRPTKAQREDAAALVMLTGATVVPQPGDGNCLFHALSYGLADGSNAHALRQEVAAFLENNASTEISGTPLSEWVRWDTGTSISGDSRAGPVQVHQLLPVHQRRGRPRCARTLPRRLPLRRAQFRYHDQSLSGK
mmetsp:Transcript_25088/g.62163  ORF Transcript_25088/g.62163 Transcript_25088/m.62163 type:complete len:650 (+) Transcript_25088:249-2198(+)